MKASIIKARIKRNQFVELAGSNFRDGDAEIIKYLNSINKQSIVGIQREDGIYTIIGERCIYYLTPLGAEGEISFEAFLHILRQNAWSLGKGGKFEFVSVNELDAVWLKDGPTMSAMWNTLLLLHQWDIDNK